MIFRLTELADHPRQSKTPLAKSALQASNGDERRKIEDAKQGSSESTVHGTPWEKKGIASWLSATE